MTKYKCRTCGYEDDDKLKMFEHLNESDEIEEIFQEGYDEECSEFYEIENKTKSP